MDVRRNVGHVKYQNEARVLHNLHTWQHFHPCVLDHIDRGMSQTNYSIRSLYNDLKSHNEAALHAHTMLMERDLAVPNTESEPKDVGKGLQPGPAVSLSVRRELELEEYYTPGPAVSLSVRQEPRESE